MCAQVYIFGAGVHQQRRFMGKFSIYLILAGMLLVLASCVPVMSTLYRMATPDPPQRLELLPGGKAHRVVDAAQYEKVVLSLVFDFVVEEPDQVDLRYAYHLKNGARIQQHDAGAIELHKSRGISPEDAGGSPGHVEKRFPILQLDDGQETVAVDIELPGYGNDKAYALIGARAELNFDPPYFALSFVNAIVVWTLGILLVLIGAIQWARIIAASPVRLELHPTNEDDRFWCMCCHLGALLGYVFPFGHILAPLLIWVTKRHQVPGVDAAGRESLNFQLTVTLVALIGMMLSAVVVGLIMLFVAAAFHFSMTLVASLRAQRGIWTKYPINIRIIRSAG